MRGHLLLLLSSVLFSSSIICTNRLLVYIPTFTLNSMRFLVGGGFLCILGRGIPFKLLKINDVLWSLLRGCLGITFYYILETLALKFISAQMVSILVGLSFVFSVSYEMLKREVRITKRITVIISLILLGMGIVSWSDLIKTSLLHLQVGISLMIAANISWVAYIRLEKTKPPSLGQLQVVGLDMLLGAICILPGAMLEIPRYRLGLLIQMPLMPVVIQFIYLAIFPSAIAYYFYNKAIEIMPSSICSIYLNLIPILSILALKFTSTNTLTLYEWIGLIEIALCVIYTSYYYEKQKVSESVYS